MAARAEFSFDAPLVVACEEVTYYGQTFARGEPFPWRDLGVSELDVLLMWQQFKLDVVESAAESAAGFVAGGTIDTTCEPSGPQVVAFIKTPSETVRIDPPSPVAPPPRHGRRR